MAAPRGRVHLVGAGPGDPGLMTARALQLIARADTILYDRLIPPSALDGARGDAELLFVGKVPHHPGAVSVPQEQTQSLMIERALAGREVVRLKGGDPFVFGRGGEEALALREAGIEFTVVPGITAGVAALAYAGIPVTHRGLSTGVALMTGHEDPDKQESQLDFEALARFPGTLVFYMGVRALERIAASLIAAGRGGGEPAALVERGTLPDQRTLPATLSTLAQVAEREQVRAPAIAVIGPVAALAEQLGGWPAPAPLAGVSVAVTRARARSSELARRLQALGADVVQAPSIRTVPRAAAAIDPSGYDLICLTSPVGVDLLFERLDDGVHPRGDARALAGARVAAIGPGTARALHEHGVRADVVPERFVAESLVDALSGVEVRRALLARASEARDVLPDALRARGAEVDVVALYDTVAERLSPRAREAARGADYVTFTSSSTVRFFLAALADDENLRDAPKGGLSPRTSVVSIGPVTSATLREHGIEPDVEAERHDIDGLVQALLAAVDAGDSASGGGDASGGDGNGNGNGNGKR
ncbi:MAG TPA: uroporphyrinogen-III C-methyltransferase [Solirubrobacteraceae bacterium]|nr:uroporphyrinogen-III C-methyltransferase [Solirubrobacteraceae bacterium]